MLLRTAPESALPPSLPLLLPPHRQVFPQLLEAQAVGFVAAQDRLDELRREAGQAQHAPGVGAVYVVGVGQICLAATLSLPRSTVAARATTTAPLQRLAALVGTGWQRLAKVGREALRVGWRCDKALTCREIRAKERPGGVYRRAFVASGR